ncbi:MAG: type IV secretory system conjugative DNA transfer family protein [Pseudomonadota bacterium]
MDFSDNELNRFGSAGFSDEYDLRRAGMLKASPKAVFLGFTERQAVWYHGTGGLLLVAGARGGKLRDLLAYNICNGILSDETLVVLDMKGELAAISQDQTPDQKFCGYWNPMALHGLPAHRINPLEIYRRDSPSLVSDIKVLFENLIPLSGSANGQYFERRAREFGEGIALTLVQLHGCLTYPDLYRVINLIPGGGDAWLDFAFEMSECGFPVSQRVEEEIASSRDSPEGGFRGILGELFKAFAPLSDPILMNAVSPHADGTFDIALADISSGPQKWQFYLMPPAEFIDAWSPVIKSVFVTLMLYKSRAPSAPRQTWVLDECAQLGGFPLVVKLFTYGAGIGIRPWAVFQSTYQMDQLGPNARNVITSSAALQSYFAVRDIDSAEAVSRRLGAQTLEYDDPGKAEQARHAKAQMMEAMLRGDDPMSAGLRYAHRKREAAIRPKQHRLLRTPDEVLNMRPDRQFIFADGLAHPIEAQRRPYFEQAFMAGRYHQNPYYHDPRGIRVKSRWGHRHMRMVREAVPARFAHYPQYRDGYWTTLR